MSFDKCPVCGAGLEMTKNVWMEGCVFKLSSYGGLDVVDEGVQYAPGEESFSMYCANDHSAERMVKHIEAGLPVEEGWSDEAVSGGS